MSIWKIAFRSLQQRGLASLLTTGSMALGVMLVVCVLSIHGIVAEQFRNNSSLGYNIIVGAKGGKLQLTMNSVYYLSQPIENIPYEYYLEFKRKDQRDQEIKTALHRDAMQAQWQSLQLQSSMGAASGVPGGQWVADLAMTAAAQPHDDRMDLGRDGQYGQFTSIAIPLCLGDYLGQFRVVGTTPDMFNALKFGPAGEREYGFREGRNFQHKSEEHGYFEAVLGSHVARKLKIAVGDKISPSHGAPDGHEHARQFTIVGILESTGTPNDRAVFVNMEGFYLMENHAKPIEAQGMFADKSKPDEPDQRPAIGPPKSDAPEYVNIRELEPLPLEQREITAILIRTVNPIVAVGLPNAINEGNVAQAVTPVSEIFNLFERIVGPIQKLLFALTIVICLVSGISILVSIYNSMNERRQEIAVMRALGAGRGTILRIILAESVLLAIAGGILGWVLGHGVNSLASPLIEDQTGVAIGFFDLAPPVNFVEMFELDIQSDFLESLMRISPELLLIPALVGLAVLVGLLPAIAAYRTDVAKSLGK